MSCLKLLEQLLEQQLDSSSKDTLARKNVAKKLEKMLLEATLGFEGETRCHWLSSLDEVRLLPGDSLVTCRIDAVKRALQDQPCPSLKSLKSGEEQTKLLSKSVSKMLNNFVVPTVLDDDSADSIAAHLSQSEARSYHGTLLAIQATEDGNHKGFIYSRRISRKLSKRSTLVCNLDTAYTVADASLAFPVHPGDQIQFKLNTCKQQNEIDVFDIVVTDYYSLNDKEITSYIDDLEKCSKSTESDFTDPLLKVTNFLPMWKYIMNARQLPENVSRKVVVLHNCIVKSRTSQLQQSRMETLMRSYIGAKFLDNLYDQVGKEVDLADVCEFLSSFVKYLPTSAFAVVRLISRLTELLNQSGQMETSCKFLMEVVTTTCVPPRTTSISSLRWDQTPLIVTPQELSVLTQAGGGKHAHLPVVQTKGPYESLNAYYNTYFRLLREDCFGEACRLIGAAKLGQLNEDTDVVYHVSGFTGLHFLRNGRGMAYGVKIEPSSDIDWTTSDVLKSENLVCLSIDGKFEDEKMIWATIATQNGSRIANLQKGELFVQFCTEANERSDAEVILLLRDSKHAVMVESPTFFRAYYPVLKSLQQRKIEETPFQDELLRFQSSAVGLIDPNSKLDWKVIFKPKNSSEEMPYTTVGELDAVTKDHNFECLLDDSQLDALKLACSQPLTIIQGPPGTGKSYIGVKLVQLFRTIGALSIAKKPILILTYKNRVLDQFLEDCLQFCPLGKIVRVGKVGSRKLESRGLTAVLHREKLKHRRYARRIHYDSISRLKTLKHELHRAGRQLELSDCLNVDMIMSRATTEQLQSLLYGDEDITEEDSEILSKLRFKDNADLKELKRNKDFKQLVTRSADRWIGKALQQSPEESKEEKKARMPSLFRAQGSKSATRQSEDKDSDLSSELFQGKTLEQERLWSIDDEEPNVYGEKKVDEGPQSISFNYESSQEWKINISKQRSPENVQPRLANCTDVWILDPDERRLLAQSWLGRQCKAAADQFTSAAKEYDDICEHIQDRNRLIKFEILKSVDIVGMTTTGAAIHQQLLTAVEPAVVIVEEACEVLEAQLLATLTSSVKHLIMIGDHAQLRPKVACHWLSQHHHFDRSMFERLVSNQFPHKTLQNQRRMREEFTELLKPYYSYLQSHSQVKEIRIPKCFGSYHMFFWSYEKEYEKKRVSGTIIVNEKEVLMVVTLVLALLICGELSESITALSPYRAQESLNIPCSWCMSHA
ncbi:NFX1-type zinc finger-containing protein 1-like isoform X2 [Corticium candelabrum]|uniref:NFX1-type zinc finger-containing protein 1-like isoform X2 n=1 Tax=Corticium candelabrum TaxID=121492 RepID=UPI002E255213|nr:NFX1-type zinc finger-containing protein 1-like isoform X2 [Corticium candelabrum]